MRYQELTCWTLIHTHFCARMTELRRTRHMKSERRWPPWRRRGIRVNWGWTTERGQLSAAFLFLVLAMSPTVSSWVSTISFTLLHQAWMALPTPRIWSTSRCSFCDWTVNKCDKTDTYGPVTKMHHKTRIMLCPTFTLLKHEMSALASHTSMISKFRWVTLHFSNIKMRNLSRTSQIKKKINRYKYLSLKRPKAMV